MEVLVAFEPHYLALGRVSKDQVVTRTVAVTGTRVAALRLSEVSSNRPELRARLVKMKGQPALEVTLRPVQEGSFYGVITARTNIDGARQLALTVRGTVVGDLVPDRGFVFFTPFDAKNPEPPRLQLTVSSTSGRRFAIRNVEDPAGVVNGVARRRGKRWVVQLTLTREPARWGKILLHTDRRDQQTIEVRYSARGGEAARASRLSRGQLRRDLAPIKARRVTVPPIVVPERAGSVDP